MGRLPRPTGGDLVYHALNRGNNRAAVFAEPSDYQAFLQGLARTQLRFPFQLFGYCLMPNHFHLLLRPGPGVSISRILQSLTVAHTWRFHQRHQTLGHVWQGRFKSPVVQDDEHFWMVLRYIEANPLRASLVAHLKEYRWSSYAAHALGQADPLLTEPPAWQTLAATEPKRHAAWRDIVATALPDAELERVRQSARSGRPFGTEAWIRSHAPELGLPATLRKRGRPRKNPA
jgi:putative transposase